MQTLGLQTVLTMSNAAERVQQVAQTHGAVAADQFKEVIKKETELKSTEVQSVEPPAVELKIKDEAARRQQREREKRKEEEAEPEMKAEAAPAPPAQGNLLDIKV